MNFTHIDMFEAIDSNTFPTRLFFPDSNDVRIYKAVSGNGASDVYVDVSPIQITVGGAGQGVYYVDVYAYADLTAATGNALVEGVHLFAVQPNTGTEEEGYAIRIVSRTSTLIAEVEDVTASATGKKNSVLGRLYTVEKNQTDVLMPRLRRALGLLGEYQVADAFVYDDDGNITKCRIRIFSGQSPADSAPVWLDTDNETDPVNTAVQTSSGEIARYEINATNSLPRNLRTKFMQDFEPTQTISDENYGKAGNDDGTTGNNNGSVL